MGFDTEILLIEDDPQLGRALLHALADSAYDTTWAQNMEDGDLLLCTHRFDGVLLDLGLPDGSGLDVLKRMRRRDDRTPVLILTARDSVEDRVRGLDEGADDYLPKPFAVPELLSRVRALLRRSAGFASREWKIRDLCLDPQTRSLTRGGVAVHLSPREFQVFLALARMAGRVVSRGQLEEAISKMGAEPESNAIEVHVHHLRRKIGNGLVRTVRGLGYLLEAE
jgi:DNA-binding response OmpR family regulator